jgi:phage shock protein A
MQEFFSKISGNLVDFIVYTLIVVVMLVGLVKCIFPMRYLSRLFRRATRNLEIMTVKENTRPIWQEKDFLGKPMQKQWKRFLINAEQLDARGLSLDVEQYINDESVLVSYAHMNVAEAVPGMLTTLGILGTFIGLMRGVSGLDVTNAEATMVSISQMIGGMEFAYGTSIAGLACSFVFNILSRTSQGSVTGAMDDFIDTFRELVMPIPLDDNVHNICYLEDKASYLRRTATEIKEQLSTDIGYSINRSFEPIARQISGFVAGQTQTQIEGLNMIVNRFVDRMDGALRGQLSYLAENLSVFNKSQQVSLEGVNQALTAADSLMQNMGSVNKLNSDIISRFENYVNELSASQAGNAHLAKSTGDMLSSMHSAMNEISTGFARLKDSHRELEKQMEAYASWSGRVLEAVEKQSDNVSVQVHGIANDMASSGRLLKDSYSSFVEDITRGFARSISMFEENMRDISLAFTRQMSIVKDDENAQKLSLAVEKLTEIMEKASEIISGEQS